MHAFSKIKYLPLKAEMKFWADLCPKLFSKVLKNYNLTVFLQFHFPPASFPHPLFQPQHQFQCSSKCTKDFFMLLALGLLRSLSWNTVQPLLPGEILLLPLSMTAVFALP